MNLKYARAITLAVTGLLAATPALAHRQWMVPSATIISGDDVWVTFAAAVSNDLFYADHQPMRTAGVRVTAPDGSESKIENASTGRYRSTFDVHLNQKGTWKIENSSDMLMGSYKLNGEEKRLPRGTTAATLAAAM